MKQSIVAALRYVKYLQLK